MINETYIKAGDAETLSDELCRLARHPEKAIRRRVAENYNTPLSSLLSLAVDPEPDVRVAIVYHSAVPIALLVQLAQDECADVRYELAEIARLPPGILGLLANDDNPYVAFRARRTLLACEVMLHKTRKVPKQKMIGHTCEILDTGTAFARFETDNADQQPRKRNVC